MQGRGAAARRRSAGLPKSTKASKPAAKERSAPVRGPAKLRAEDAKSAAPAAPSEMTIALGGDLRIGRARDLYTALTESVVPGTTVIVDGAEVAKVDAAGLQCVLAAAVHLRTAGVSWRWHNPSLALKSAAQLLGLDGALELT